MKSEARGFWNERNFLCEVLRRFIHGHDPPDVPESLDWDRFENIAAVNGLIPILYVSMNSSQSRRLDWNAGNTSRSGFRLGTNVRCKQR